MGDRFIPLKKDDEPFWRTLNFKDKVEYVALDTAGREAFRRERSLHSHSTPF